MTTRNITLTFGEDTISLQKQDLANQGTYWVSEKPLLKIKQATQINESTIISKDNILKDIENDLLIELFFEQWQQLEAEKQNTEFIGIDESDEYNFIEKSQFNHELIRVTSTSFTVFETCRNIDNLTINMWPDFQRKFVWDAKLKSGLIESLLLRIPIPVFYFSEDKDASFQVVDGLQRLTTIHDFVNNKFALKDLEYLSDSCNKKKFSALEPKYQRIIELSRLSINIIDPQTPISVKFELFKRINKGGKALNLQEIRNSIAKPHTRDLLKFMSNSEEFKIATNHSIKSLRMEDQELFLRFIGFYRKQNLPLKEFYRGNMQNFLDETLDSINDKKTIAEYENIRIGFINAMQNAHHLFGTYAFRKCKTEHLKPSAKQQLINKSLFTIWAVLLSQYDYKTIEAKNEQGFLSHLLAEELEKNRQYFDSLTTGTNQVSNLEYAFEIAKHLITGFVKV